MGRAMMLIMAGLSLTLSNVRSNHVRMSERNLEMSISEFNEQQLRNVASSATNIAVSKLYRDYTWRTGYDTLMISGGSCHITVQDNDVDTTLKMGEVKVTTIARVGDQIDTIIVKMDKPAFSKYAIFTDNQPTPIYYITGDTITGPMHTNSKYYFAGTPVFKGKVTSVDPEYVKYNVTTDPQFLKGAEFGVDRIELPIDLNEIYNVAASGGKVFDKTVKLVFNGDGTYTYQTYEWNGYMWYWSAPAIEDMTTSNGVIVTTDDHNIFIEGTIKGKVTVASGGNIYITNDLVYATNPIAHPTSSDVAGLIAKQNVIIKDIDECKPNCEIHASIMALNKSFYVENYSSNDAKGVLTVLGGIIQDERGAVGTFNYVDGKTVIASGYLKDYIYDDRFFKLEPPYFPTVEKPQIGLWEEKTVAER
ncbi:DUF4900 domain-containing protein [candidate division KSB1 bacterium]|nr:DUF4900 domain-containing protein [candidate division KSB1 bacterium]